MKLPKVFLITSALFFLAVHHSLAVEPSEPTGICCTTVRDCPNQEDYICELRSASVSKKCKDEKKGECYRKTDIYKYYPLYNFQQELEECNKNGTISLECWVGGQEAVAEKPETAATGVGPAVVNTLTTMIIGSLPGISGTAYRPGGAIGGITNLIAAMYANPPASSVDYFADLGRNLGIVKPAYAQEGFGFQGLRPILPLWKNFRNIAYLFFTIIFVVIGFAIMFRLKLNPQTVISIQNAIPRIVIALILVTFSYAIAGLLIDFMYVVTAVIVGVINPGGILHQLVDLLEEKLHMGGGKEAPNILVFQLLFIGKGLLYAYTLATNLLNPREILKILDAPTDLLRVIQAIIKILGAAFSTVLILILAVVLLYAFFKLFLSLLKAYVSILIIIIFSPLQIMLGVFPGQTSFSSWLRNFVANLAVFPTVIILIALTSKLVELAEGEGLWVPPPLTPPIVEGKASPYSIEMITAIIAYGMLILTPKIADMIKDALKVKPFPYGTAIGEALRVGARVPYVTGKTIYGKLTEEQRLIKEAKAKMKAEAQVRKQMTQP